MQKFENLNRGQEFVAVVGKTEYQMEKISDTHAQITLGPDFGETRFLRGKGCEIKRVLS